MPTPPSAGTMVTNSVKLVRQLGAGGMGSVWIADHLTLRTQVVVKFIAHALAGDAVNVARFSREAAAASQVKSPHVVQMFDHGVSTEGVPFIVMELLEGEDLAHRMLRQASLPPVEVARIVGQVGKALMRAHDRGIVHRDIKPENIFLCDVGGNESFVKVLDFGIAKGGETLVNATTTGAMMGTPYYMSPEQMVGAKEVDHRTDLWSLAVVAFQMLTGARPFDGETIGALAIAIHSQQLPRPSAVNPALSPSIDAWFQRACARDPKARFATARELTSALDAALGLATEGQVSRRDSAGDSGPQPTMRIDGGRNDTNPKAAEIGLEKTQVAGSGTIPTNTNAATSVEAQTLAPKRRSAIWIAVAAIALVSIGGAALILSGQFTAPSTGSSGAATASSSATNQATTTSEAEATTGAPIATRGATDDSAVATVASAQPSVSSGAAPSSKPSGATPASATTKPTIGINTAPTKIKVVTSASATTAPTTHPSSGYDDIQ